MNTLNLGPLALPISLLPWLIALVVAGFAGSRWRKRGQDIEAALWWVPLASLVGARVAFILRYPDQFADIVSLLDVRDGGWWWPGALVGGLLMLGALLWRWPGKRPALLTTTAVAVFTGTLVLATVEAVSPDPEMLPEVTLYTLDGENTSIMAGTEQAPLTLVNLWASWCPPCRREMPVLQAGQQRYPAVNFVYANQGEAADTITTFLQQQQLSLDTVLQDPHGDLGRALGSGALPATLLLDAQGRILEAHTGPLSQASLHHLVSPHQE